VKSDLNQDMTRDQIPSPNFETSTDSERLTDVFRSQRQRLFWAAMRLLGNIDDAEDAVQEGLLSAIRNWHRFEGRARLSTWLTRIVVNAALMPLRSLRAHALEPIDEPVAQQGGVRFSDLLIDGRPDPEEDCLREEQRRILTEGMKALSRSHRRALLLHDVEGLTSKEAGEVLGLSEGTVKSQVHRARRRLSQHVRRLQDSPALANLVEA
jgi:RNA polymerase sigma-70 factor, ECF subfamily